MRCSWSQVFRGNDLSVLWSNLRPRYKVQGWLPCYRCKVVGQQSDQAETVSFSGGVISTVLTGARARVSSQQVSARSGSQFCPVISGWEAGDKIEWGMMSEDPKPINLLKTEYKLLGKIGSGGFSFVYLVENISSGVLRAAKGASQPRNQPRS